jgi:peptide/nickel transport system substrate-binding protein
MKRFFVVLMFVLMLTSSIVGCTAAPTQPAKVTQPAQPSAVPQAVVKDTLTIAETGEPQTLDPYAHSNEVGFYITHQIYENLIKTDEKGNYIPWLATSWTLKDDKTIVFKLRNDVFFQDGTPFTANDVAFTLALASTSSFTSNLFGSIDPKGFVIPNDFEIEVHLKTPNAALLSAFANTARGMVSKKYYETASKEDIARKPMGTGPMVFKQWVTGDRIILATNPKYWGAPIAYKNFVARFITEASSRAIELETGGVDIAFVIAPADQPRIKNNPATKLISGNTQGVSFVTFNSSIKPFDDYNLRQALSYALDLKALVQVAWGGQAAVADSYYSDTILGHIAVGPHEYNVDKAKEFLAKAGYPNGYSFTFTTYENTLNQKFSEAAQAMWAKAGITCKIEVVDLAQFTTMNNDGKIGVSMMTNTAVINDPSAALLAWPTARTISIRHMDKHVDELLDKGIATYEQADRVKLYGELQQYLWSKLYTLPVAFPMGAYASTSNVTNLPFAPNLLPDLTKVKFLKP